MPVAKLVLLDFDGVLIDSARETVFTAYNATTGETLTASEQLPPHFESLLLQARPLVHPAGEFITLTREILKAGAIPSRVEWEALRASDPVPLAERTALFFSARKRFQSKAMDHWYALHRPYEPFFHFVKTLPLHARKILTNKNREAVIQICSFFGWEIAPEDIYSGDGGTTKQANLKTLRSHSQASDLIFIDDQLKNLLDLDDVERVLALWGYSTAAERDASSAHGVLAVNQSDAIAFFQERLR